ncbi:unnamed protein product [Ectocarpus sp. 8 AP-2014]
MSQNSRPIEKTKQKTNKEHEPTGYNMFCSLAPSPHVHSPIPPSFLLWYYCSAVLVCATVTHTNLPAFRHMALGGDFSFSPSVPLSPFVYSQRQQAAHQHDGGRQQQQQQNTSNVNNNNQNERPTARRSLGGAPPNPPPPPQIKDTKTTAPLCGASSSCCRNVSRPKEQQKPTNKNQNIRWIQRPGDATKRSTADPGVRANKHR